MNRVPSTISFVISRLLSLVEQAGQCHDASLRLASWDACTNNIRSLPLAEVMNMSDNSYPKTKVAADEEIWKLTARTRQIVQLIQHSILNTGRKKISEAKQLLDDTRSARQAEVKNARNALQAKKQDASNERQTQISSINRQIDQPRSETQNLFQVARVHTIKQGAYSYKTAPSLTSSSTHTVQSGISIVEVQPLVLNLNRLVNEEDITNFKTKRGLASRRR